MKQKIQLDLHTRHIPIEHLAVDTPMGIDVIKNGLADSLDSPLVDRLKEFGINIVETRCVWYMLEKERGILDFSRLERDIRKIQQNGFKVGLLPWFNFPPAWNKEITFARCLEHDTDSSIASLWDPRLLEAYDRLYGALAKKFGKDIDFLYFAIYGDYGEQIFPAGVNHYRFSSPHGHIGYWCGDALARQDYHQHVIETYNSLADANEAWGTNYHALDNDILCLPGQMTLAQRIDFMHWYTGSMITFTEKTCKIIRKHFPNVEGSLPIGCVAEELELGNIKSEAARIAAENGLLARWTGWAHLGDYARSNVLCRRVASAATFYGTRFGVEAALLLERDNAWNAIYEAVSNNAVQVHNDPGNIVRAEGVFEELERFTCAEERKTDWVVFYPVEAEMVGLMHHKVFLDQFADLRSRIDYELADSYMIRNGCLNDFNHLVLPDNCYLPSDTIQILQKWSENLNHTLYAGTKPKRLETSKSSGLKFSSLVKLPDTKPYYETDFGNHVTRYWPDEGLIEEVPQHETK